ncbi:hypothetical protein MMC13_001855 [Lambiella insularis]|nr:hypothetical protein [Lambiella insularis]
MALVGYSDSEGSEEESEAVQKAPIKPGTSAKPTFQKVIDRSNPHKIKVTLPEAPKAERTEESPEDGPPAKRPKVAGGAFTGFNSFLPAPKRAANAGEGQGSRRGGLGSGVNLKTGAAPGFSREPMHVPDSEADGEQGHTFGDEEVAKPGDAQVVTVSSGQATTYEEGESLEQKPKRLGNPMMFKPLSVARKPQKKKKPQVVPQTVEQVELQEAVPPPKAAAKLSLFSMVTPELSEVPSTGNTNGYQPLVYQVSTTSSNDDNAKPLANENYYVESEVDTTAVPPTFVPPDAGPQSLSSIASDLNLSSSARRQLFGRQRNNGKGDSSAINVVNFNIDQEYAANEILRQAGEQVQHNPVKALAAGKHSLKQLVNAASNQKDALEEAFASGRRNKKEAGSKYGW